MDVGPQIIKLEKTTDRQQRYQFPDGGDGRQTVYSS